MDRESPEKRLADLGLALPPVTPMTGTFVPSVRSGNLLFLTGQLPVRENGAPIFGKLGEDMDADAGYEAARCAGLATLVTLKQELGSLDRVKQILRIFGVVNATAAFREHTKVINGASDLFVEVFGEAGRHARLAVGVSSLPANLCLEIEPIVEIDG